MRSLFFAALLFASAAQAAAPSDLARTTLGAAAKFAAQLNASRFEFKRIENKPLLSTLKQLVESLRGREPFVLARERGRAFGAVVEEMKLKDAKLNAAALKLAALSLTLPVGSNKPLDEELRAQLVSLGEKARTRRDAAMVKIVERLGRSPDVTILLGMLRGHAFYLQPVYRREWTRLVEAAEERRSTAHGAAATIEFADKELEEQLRRIESWEVIDDSRAISLLAPELPAEKEALGAVPESGGTTEEDNDDES